MVRLRTRVAGNGQRPTDPLQVRVAPTSDELLNSRQVRQGHHFVNGFGPPAVAFMMRFEGKHHTCCPVSVNRNLLRW